jgi:hypothetical protein
MFPRRTHPIHYDETPSGTKGTGQVRQYFFGCGQLMVRIRNEDRVGSSRGEMRIIHTADDRLKVVLSPRTVLIRKNNKDSRRRSTAST